MSAKTDVVVKLVLVFFISLLSFSIGTFVGKKYSDNQHKMAALEPSKTQEHGTREVASAEGTEHGAVEAAPGSEHVANKSGESMSDEEIAKLAEEFVSDDTTATSGAVGEHKGEEHAKTEGHQAEERKTAERTEVAPTARGVAANPVKTRNLETSEPLAAAKNIVQNHLQNQAHGTARTAEETRVPSSIPKDVAQYNTGKFTVQVGSYAREEEAQKVAGELKAKNYSAYYIPANVKGQTWYRVSVGLFATPREAQAYRAELMAKSKITSAIVQKIVQ
jgi:cell division septation protein DedD